MLLHSKGCRSDSYTAHKIIFNTILCMAEIKEFTPSTKEEAKPERPADVIDIESTRDKKEVIRQTRELANKLENQLEK